ncbi:MAG: diguanylate cyclase [Candidatus Omnitrophica bacterium]|nr:diguanylate cyclase [Candidatus Omnitrophota bacterium]MCM8791466.1 diguanylate cyclase [Candidatus Omnitrophota bacterium]
MGIPVLTKDKPLCMLIKYNMIFSSLKRIYNLLYQEAIKHKRGVGWLLAFVVTFTLLVLYHFDMLERLELLTLDLRFNLRHMKAKESDIVFIDMAEDSVNAIGRWPWPRKWHATIIQILSQYKPKAIAFDVIFSEPQDENDDLVLEEAMRQSGIVYMPSIYDMNVQRLKFLYKGEGVNAIHRPLDRFLAQAKGTGHINAIPDSDGILRRVPPIIGFGGNITYQFGMRIGFSLLGVKEEDILFDPKKHDIIFRLPTGELRRIPLDRNNQLIVNWLGRWGNEFNHYSFIDVIRSYVMIREGKKPIVDLNEFRDKICIIGLTAAGLIDIKPIPIQNAYPAVGTNAMMVHGVMKSDFLMEAPQVINYFLVILVSVLATIYLCNLRVLSGIIFAILGIVSYLAFSVAIFILFKTIIVTFYPIFGIMMAYVVTASYAQILQSVERTRLLRQATRDGLTHLYNIRHFNLLLEAEFRNAAVYKFRNLSLMMADLDNFKKLNDTYGHQAGDLVLKEVAHIIQSKCRQVDVVGRYGGEEFIVMLTGAKIKDAADVAEKIRAAVEAKKFKFKNELYSTSLSIGVVEYTKEKTKDELVEKADTALYNAKREGKNRVCIYKEGMTQEE